MYMQDIYTNNKYGILHPKAANVVSVTKIEKLWCFQPEIFLLTTVLQRLQLGLFLNTSPTMARKPYQWAT